MNEQYRLPARLKAARKAAGYKTSRAFIDAHDIPPSTYSQHETGRRAPNDATLKEYSKLFNVNFEWLKTGEGSAFSSRTNRQAKETLKEEMLDLHSQASNQSLNEELLTAIIEQLLKQPKKQSSAKIAKATAEIYQDIVSSESETDIQIKMVTTAVKAFMRYQGK